MKHVLEKFPILEQLDPSAEQLPAIVERGGDVAVTAGAGTGKTRTLVSRFLALLSDGNPLRSIVAITFTIKAAREMRNRVREEIRRYLLNEGLTLSEREFWRAIYENLDSAQISTIHSFAADILRQHPAELGLDPDFELIDEGLSARLKNQAVDAALAWAAEDRTASVLFPIYGDWRLRRTLRGLLNRRLELQSVIRDPSAVSWENWESILITQLKAILENPEVKAGMSEFLSYEENGILQSAIEEGDLLVSDMLIVIEEWKGILAARSIGDWIDVSRRLCLLRSHLKQKGKKANWAPADPRSVIKKLQPIFEEMLPGEDLDLEVDKKIAEQIVPGLLAVLSFADKYYTELKRQIEGLDFDDLEIYILDLFDHHKSALNYWQDQIHHLLIDEYQDTNQRQRSMINALNGSGERLFIVGDGKQSIYRFRGADVAVFRQEKERISSDGSCFELSTSYRGHRELIQNLNGMLAPVLGLESGLPWVEPFSALVSGREDLPAAALDPYVEFHLTVGTKADGAGRSAALAVASRIQNLVGTGDPASDGGNYYDYGEIAVLCRASSSFGDFEEAFQKFGIPYITISGQGFYNRPEIRDLINALRVFTDPDDDLAAAGLLRSPVIGISDSDLFRIRSCQIEGGYKSLLQAAADLDCQDNKSLKYKLDSFLRIVKKYTDLVGRVSVSSLLNSYLEDTELLSSFYLLDQQRCVQNIRKLTADAEQSGIVSVAEYLRIIGELKDVVVREGEAQGVAEGAVQIMTVHQAKGMEFPVVILGDISKKSRRSREILIDDAFGLRPPFTESRVEEHPEPRLVTGSSLAYQLGIKREREKEDAESRRLFYVAATRAKDLLILSGTLGRLTKSNQIGKTGGWLGYLVESLGLSSLELDSELDGGQTRVKEVNGPGFSADLYFYDGKVEFDPIIVKPEREDPTQSAESFIEAWDKLIMSSGKDKKPVETRREIYPYSSNPDGRTAPARIVGDVVHRALQIWKFPSGGEVSFMNWAKAEFNRHGIANNKVLEDGVRRVIDLLERFQDHDLFERMNNADVLLHEVPFSIPGPNGLFENGVIDALFKEGDKWYLVEFKSDQIRDQKRFDFIWSRKGYQDQVASYLNAVEMVLGERPEGTLCFLNYAGKVHLVTGIWD